MVERIRVEKNGVKGWIRHYLDDRGFYQVQVQIDDQKALNYKQFDCEESAREHLDWILENWTYLKKEVPAIRVTPKLVS